MKLLKSILENSRHLLFLDLEGTQFDHEVIAVGAVLIDCNSDFIPCGEPKSFSCYINAKTNIGSVIVAMTGITKEILEKQGVTFSEAMSQLNAFVGNKSNNTKVLTYGNQDVHMLACSYKLETVHTPFLKPFINYLIRNNVDMGTFFSRYIRGKKNELISLTHMREFFNIPPSGNPHDPLVDSLDLFHIYQAFASDKNLVKESYKRLLKTSNIVPDPLKKIVVDLVDGKDVTSLDFDSLLDSYFE